MPNCTTTGHQLTITWVNIIFIFTHCQHGFNSVSIAILYSLSQPFVVKTLQVSLCNCLYCPIDEAGGKSLTWASVLKLKKVTKGEGGGFSIDLDNIVSK